MQAETEIPAGVRAATTLWISAVAMGAFETILAVTQLPAFDAGTAVGLGVRVVIYAAAVFLALLLCRRQNWARAVLAVGLGVFGTISLVIEPVQWLLAGNSPGRFLAEASTMTLVAAGSRLVHLAAVLGAMVLMFGPPANAFFRGAPTGEVAGRRERV